jgi:hypothetical protein
MTEAEWLACTDPGPILEYLRGRASDRKLRLFAAACCRRIWHFLTDARSREAVEVAARYADGRATEEERQTAADAAHQAVLAAGPPPDFERAASAALNAAVGDPAVDAAAESPWIAALAVAGNPYTPDPAERAAQYHLFADIFGPLPVRPVTIDPRWLSWNHGTVPAIARRLYEERAFHDLPILADALEEAGCDQADLLGHLRGPGPHVRGCWAVDRLLGKE